LTTWFTSDLHFGHKNIIKYRTRPWASVQEIDEALVANWNAVVKPEDEVWNLGDVAFCCKPEYAAGLLERLNGKHHLLMGNHDEVALTLRLRDKVTGAPDGDAPPGWRPLFGEFTSGVHEVTIEDQKIVLCHYAMRTWHHAQRGVWHLFGHTHGALRPFGKSVDVGVDNVAEVLSGVYRPPAKDSHEPYKSLVARAKLLTAPSALRN
jgi:calcineurin-like phosphoesterase family protein